MLNQATIDKIVALAGSSDLARYNWSGRGRAPAGYIKGMAVTYALCLQKLMAKDSAALAMVRRVDGEHDVFDHYEVKLRAAGMFTEGAPNVDRLRALFVILIGLGMRESSGRYCEGRDRSATNTSSETAEAGLFQQSYDSRRASLEIEELFEDSANAPTYRDIFKEGIIPQDGDLDNYGDGAGRTFQAMCKASPAFAVQVAAIGLRTLYIHWGPIVRREAELRPEADAMFKQVQRIVAADYPVVAQKPGSDWLSALIGAVAAFFRRPAVSPPPAPVVPVQAAGTPWMSWALKEVGFHETGVNLGIEKYIDLSKNGTRSQLLGEPWCADFSNAALEVNGIRGTRSAMARSYEHSEYFVKLDGPAYGAVVTLWRGSTGSDTGHVCFYLGEGEKGILGLGGNQSDSVSRAYHPRNRVTGYWWPKSRPLPSIGPIASSVDASEGSET